MAGISRPVVSTDPPYYDNIGYANLSDFFYVWLRRCLAGAYPTLFSTMLTPKDAELIAEPGRFGNDRERAMDHFEQGSTKAFTRFRAGANADIPMTVFYAFKQQESEDADDENNQSLVSSGWEKMLTSLISSGCSIQGTWPIRTEQSGGLRESKRNALASSIVLVCRPRPADARLATRKEFMVALRQELPTALRNLQHGNIAPVDLCRLPLAPVWPCILDTRRSSKLTARQCRFARPWESSTRCLMKFWPSKRGSSTATPAGPWPGLSSSAWTKARFGVAETLSRAKNTAVNGLVEAGVVNARGGKVQLIKREGLDADWDPATDKRLTVWEIAQHLIRTQQQAGEVAAAALMHKLGGMAETARDLAYRLYSICERKKWADEALAYNGLVLAWPELTKLALAERSKAKEEQQEMF